MFLAVIVCDVLLLAVEKRDFDDEADQTSKRHPDIRGKKSIFLVLFLKYEEFGLKEQKRNIVVILVLVICIPEKGYGKQEEDLHCSRVC